MKILSYRQKNILQYIEENPNSQIKDIYLEVEKEFEVGQRTVLRDLQFLVKKEYLIPSGEGRSIAYSLSKKFNFIKEIDIDAYFSKHHIDRNAQPEFNFEVFKLLEGGIFTDKEIKKMDDLNSNYIKNSELFKRETPAIYKREIERLIIELSWKSSQIEGNTYSLLETEVLIKELIASKKHNSAETQMILNHKKILDQILNSPEEFKVINTKKIKKLHEVLVDGLDVGFDFRDKPVGITGTMYRPLPRKKIIKEAMEKLVALIESRKTPYEKAFIALIMISYLQPFEDGNKRTGRILSNAILHANQRSMLSYRDVDVIEYKKAMLLFYEQNNIAHIKKIFLDQFEFSVKNYFV